jgi:hypothetical protein
MRTAAKGGTCRARERFTLPGSGAAVLVAGPVVVEAIARVQVGAKCGTDARRPRSFRSATSGRQSRQPVPVTPETRAAAVAIAVVPRHAATARLHWRPRTRTKTRS